MSTLTKVFVVLLVVFSIAFTVQTVSVVAQTANWRDTAQRYEQHALLADTSLRSLIAANATELAAARDTVNRHMSAIGDLKGAKQKLAERVADLDSQNKRAEAEKSSADALNRGLVAQLQVADAARGEYRSQRDGLEKQNIDLQRRNIDLNDRVNELTAQYAVLIEQKRQYEQQLNILREQNNKLARAARRQPIGATLEDPTGAAMPQVTAATPVAPSAIRGQVVEVSGNIVTISVGSADGVEKGMVFVLHRDGDYVGDLHITLIDPNQAAGRLSRSNVAPKVGDRVTDAAGLGASRG